MLEAADKAWLSRLLGPGARFDEPMSRHTSFKIGGPADAFLQPQSEAELKAIIKWTRKKKIPYILIGGGTNVLVRDGGIRGLVIHTGHMATAITWGQDQQRIRVSAGAGVATRRLCAQALKRGWQGMNFALGIPGTLGGAILMNAGTAHGCMADVIETVKIMTSTGKQILLQRRTLAYRYRLLQMPSGTGDDSYPAVITACELTLTNGDREQIRGQARQWMRGRSRRQPAWQPSAGCFFKNPSPDQPAGRLIDEAGLKGMRVGGAQVSARHANFIVNRGGASAADVLNLSTRVREAVHSRFGIELAPEVYVVGEE